LLADAQTVERVGDECRAECTEPFDDSEIAFHARMLAERPTVGVSIGCPPL